MSADITPTQLMDRLIGKHKSRFKDYKTQFESLKKIGILVEKIEQLEHWMNGKDYANEDIRLKRDSSKDELEGLRKQYPIKNPHAEIASIKSKIGEHKIALDYWKDERRRIKEEG